MNKRFPILRWRSIKTVWICSFYVVCKEQQGNMTLVRHDAIYFVALSLQPWLFGFPNEAPRCPFSDLRMLSQVWFCCFLRHKFVLYIAMRGRNRAHFKYRPLSLKNPEKTFLTIFEVIWSIWWRSRFLHLCLPQGVISSLLHDWNVLNLHQNGTVCLIKCVNIEQRPFNVILGITYPRRPKGRKWGEDKMSKQLIQIIQPRKDGNKKTISLRDTTFTYGEGASLIVIPNAFCTFAENFEDIQCLHLQVGKEDGDTLAMARCTPSSRDHAYI